MPFSEQYDVVVVGAGHAGCEAAMAAARMGLKTALITMNLDLIAQMSCNPAVGGVAKGHLVREVDALGGVMGEVADAVGIQFRLLNSSRGPAVWSPRAQCDKQLYRVKMREVLESQPGLNIRQAEVVDLVIDDRDQRSEIRDQTTEIRDQEPRRRVLGVNLRDGRRMLAGATIITTGTFLNGLIHIGDDSYPARRCGRWASGPAASKPGRRRGWTAAPSAGRPSGSRRATPSRPPSASAPRESCSRRSRATLPSPPRKRSRSSAKMCTARQCIPGTSRASARAIARPSRTRSSSFPTRRSTSFFWSRRVCAPTKFT
jgi:hypothetical protein